MSNSHASPIPLFKIKVQEKGRIRDIKETIVRIDGLPSCLNGQIVDMGDDVLGIIMGYDEENVLVLVLGDTGKLRLGKEVTGVSEPFKIPVGEQFIGRVVTAMGYPVDRGDPVEATEYLPVFRDSPPITHRLPVDKFLHSGTKVVDQIVPIAKGQRQLILGDRMTGKTVITMDAIINQKGTDTICIYCCVGKSMSALEKAMATLQDSKAIEYTIVMVAMDSSPVGEQYLVPFAAASMADHFALQGKDVLVVFDDLTKHAWAYRQLSLLLERPPGREAYPGDIFYVQTQLMERAGNFNEKHGGGSMTFLGIAETLQGDLSGYIPSNLASVCDGQVCMSSSVFAEGFRPAIDFRLSLTIIGHRVQPKIYRALSHDLRTRYAQYAEIVSLSKLQSGLSEEAQAIVDQGESLLAVLQQGQYAPVDPVEQVLLVYAVAKNLLVKWDDEDRHRFRKEIYKFAQEHDHALLDAIRKEMDLTPEIDRGIAGLIEAYFANLQSGA